MCVRSAILMVSTEEVDIMPTTQKDDRIDVRVKNTQKSFLIYAATLCHKKLSAFVLDSALKEAEELASKNVHFQLPDKQWKAFCDALDKPAREIPKLKKLFKESNIFHER